MSKSLKRNIPIAKALHKCLKRHNEEDFKDMIKCLNDDCVKFLCECVRNVCDVNVFRNLPDFRRRKIQKSSHLYKNDIKKILKPHVSISKKRKILQYGSGWFLPLLATVIPMITSLFSK